MANKTNNQIFEINKDFDFSVLALGNPTLINNGSYYSKISHGNFNKNFYLQLPKCLTKQGVVKTANKTFCDLVFSSSDKKLIDFFEKLETHCVNKIMENKQLWFYNSDSMNVEDIQEITNPIMRSYKSGKNILVKTLIKSDKFNIYDEHENKLTTDEYDTAHDIIPLVNINGVKFSSKNFIIELILTQAMVLYPSDEFEKQILIKAQPTSTATLETKNVTLKELKKVEDKVEAVKDEAVKDETVKDEAVKDEPVKDEPVDEAVKEEEATEEEAKEAKDETVNEAKNEKEEKDDGFKYLINDDSLDKNKESEPVLEKLEEIKVLDGLQELDNLNIDDKSETINLKNHDTIYLEIYKDAKQKAKQIRKNAIQAFLEAKRIKNKYNLEDIIDTDSSSDDEDYMNEE